MATSFIILAAGLGSRLGGSVPKPLTVLEDGRTILQQQLDNITEVFGQDALRSVIVVLGHRSEEIHEVLPRQVKTVHNVDYEFTNTSKSLLQALSRVPRGNSALWLNGDVVFDADILRKAQAAVEADRSFVVVDEGSVADEEIKYTLDSEGLISELSKTVVGGLGEAVGINHVSSTDRKIFLQALRAVALQDYFEAAMELTIREGVEWLPLYAGDSYAVEIDFPEDLLRANDAQATH